MGDEIDLHLGKRIRRRRRLLGMTQQQLAMACGVRFQQIQKYECGANRISAARLWLVAIALDVPVGFFFEGFVTPQVEPQLASGEAVELIGAYRRRAELPPQRRALPGQRDDHDTDAA